MYHICENCGKKYECKECPTIDDGSRKVWGFCSEKCRKEKEKKRQKSKWIDAKEFEEN